MRNNVECLRKIEKDEHFDHALVYGATNVIKPDWRGSSRQELSRWADRCACTILSRASESSESFAIGRVSDIDAIIDDLARGEGKAFRQMSGKVAFLKEALNSEVIGAEIEGAANLSISDGMPSGPIAFDVDRKMALKTLLSVTSENLKSASG